MLAIVIPYYKVNFFEATLQSLASQTNKQFHVYIGNDASDTDPSNLLEAYKNSFLFTYKKFDNNLGGQNLVKQWERCIAMTASEDWIMILGDDDILGPNCVEGFYNNLEIIKKHNVNVVRFATIVIDGKGFKISKKHEHPKFEKSTAFFERKHQGGTRSSLSEYIFKKTNFKIKSFPLAWHTDDLAVLECSNYGLVYTINTSCVKFRHSSENITSNTDNLKQKNESSFQYYFYLYSDKINFFTKKQQRIVVYKLNKTVATNKKNVFRILQVSFYYLKHLKFKNLISLKIMIVKSLFRKL
ncbi:glycosyltransferase [Olleya sp. ITB9]|uniref:glycosyltransferase n=1 Tax=Olleya sp. ITB9 TaxID=1715648 RepID=UPI0006D159C6|nr:glycosyltransferase family 2 protein [Olleya sp. ITB9]